MNLWIGNSPLLFFAIAIIYFSGVIAIALLSKEWKKPAHIWLFLSILITPFPSLLILIFFHRSDQSSSPKENSVNSYSSNNEAKESVLNEKEIGREKGDLEKAKAEKLEAKQNRIKAEKDFSDCNDLQKQTQLEREQVSSEKEKIEKLISEIEQAKKNLETECQKRDEIVKDLKQQREKLENKRIQFNNLRKRHEEQDLILLKQEQLRIKPNMSIVKKLRWK